MLGLLLAHHMKSYLGVEIEINGHEFPDGPMDHALFFGIGVVVLFLTGYGAVAVVRDFWRWRRQKAAPAARG